MSSFLKISHFFEQCELFFFVLTNEGISMKGGEKHYEKKHVIFALPCSYCMFFQDYIIRKFRNNALLQQYQLYPDGIQH